MIIHPRHLQVNQQIALKDLGTTVLSSCCARSIGEKEEKEEEEEQDQEKEE